jgi:hypothetical protein
VTHAVQHCEVYRRRAAELEELAARTRIPSSREHYLRLAEEWRHLADSTEAMSERWGARNG